MTTLLEQIAEQRAQRRSSLKQKIMDWRRTRQESNAQASQERRTFVADLGHEVGTLVGRFQTERQQSATQQQAELRQFQKNLSRDVQTSLADHARQRRATEQQARAERQAFIGTLRQTIAQQTADFQNARRTMSVELSGSLKLADQKRREAVQTLLGSVRRRTTTAPVPAEVVVSPADDLTALQGIGPKTAQRLNQAGITTFTQLATTSPDDLLAIIHPTTNGTDELGLDHIVRRNKVEAWIEEAGRY